MSPQNCCDVGYDAEKLRFCRIVCYVQSLRDVERNVATPRITVRVSPSCTNRFKPEPSMFHRPVLKPHFLQKPGNCQAPLASVLKAQAATLFVKELTSG